MDAQSARLKQRCASPLILLQPEQQPQLSHNNYSSNLMAKPPTPTPLTPPTPQPESARPVGHLKNMFEQQIRLVNSVNGEPPKRTSSLGPRRPLPQRELFDPTHRQIENIAPISNARVNGTGSREQRFNKMAAELQSSITELNRLIDETTSPTVAVTMDKAPVFLEGMRSVAERRASFQTRDPNNLMTPVERTCGWDPQNDLKEMASSVTDLRSVFESSLAKASSSQPPRIPRPPSTPPVPSPNLNTTSRVYADYTIRRTTSTSSPKVCTIRNPYRSHYGLR